MIRKILARPVLALVLGAVGILGFATVLLVVLPYAQLYDVEPEPELSPYTDAQWRGRELYVSLGCVFCHTQQPRDPGLAPDAARGWGRPSTPGDYVYDYPHQLGTMRTGPDLMNVGARLGDRDWHLVHLYNPRIVADWSVMPSFPFLFEVVDQPRRDQVVVELPLEFAPERGTVVATPDALDLAEYLVALDHTYPSQYLPRESR